MKPTIRLPGLLISFIIGLLMSLDASAAVYYVAKTGADTNLGTLAQPWLTITKAANTMVAGDTVRVRSGTYNEMVVLKNSGVAGNPITYCAYSGEYPSIDATGLSTTSVAGVVTVGAKSYVIIDGFEIKNAPASKLRDGIYSTGDNNIFRNLYIHNTYASGIEQAGGSNVTIDSCTLSTISTGGTFQMITLSNVAGFEVKKCTLSSSSKVAIACKQGGSNGLIHDNEIIGSGTITAGVYINANGTAISTVKVYNNKIHNCAGYGIKLGSSSSPYASVTDIDIYNNLIYNNAGGFAVEANPFTRTFRLINNTIYQNGTATEISFSGSGSSAGTNLNCVIRNNIVYATNNNDYLISYDDSVNSGVTATDHNVFFDPDLEYLHYPMDSIGINCQTSNPLLVNPVSDLSLQSNSPAINGGSNSGIPATDYAGNARMMDSICDIGAYEYPGTITVTYSVSGYVRDSGNTGISGVTVTLSGNASLTTTTAGDGSYQFTGVPAQGTYTITPAKDSYGFNPSIISINSLSGNLTNQNFTGTATGTTLYRISGYVREGTGTGIAGVTVSLSGGGGRDRLLPTAAGSISFWVFLLTTPIR